MHITYESVSGLSPNPWNPNVVDPINMDKLIESLKTDGLQKAILIRTLEDGSKQILDGVHRVKAAKYLGWSEIACVDLGEVDDGDAMKQTLIGNSRYGDDDPLLMANLLGSDIIGSAEDLLATLPFDETTLASYFSHDNLDIDAMIEGSDENDLDIEITPAKPLRTHQILRFKVSVEDAIALTELVNRTKKEQGFTDSDDLTNAGDALVYLLGTKGAEPDEEDTG